MAEDKIIQTLKSPFAQLVKPKQVIPNSQDLLVGIKMPQPIKNIVYKDYDYIQKRKDIVVGGDSRGYTTAMPFITHEVGSSYPMSNFDDGFVRGGFIQATNVAAEDVVRITKFMATGKGLLWIAKQQGLQMTNPMPQTRIYNPATTLLQTGVGFLGVHLPRHGTVPFLEGIGNNTIGYDTYSTTKDYQNVGGWDFSSGAFFGLPRTMAKLDQMRFAAFDTKGSGILSGLITLASGGFSLNTLGLLFRNKTSTYSAPPDAAGGSAPFWPIGYLGKVNSTYGGFSIIDQAINRVVNTQVDYWGNKINERTEQTEGSGLDRGFGSLVGGNTIANEILGGTVQASQFSPSKDQLRRYKTLAYGELGTEQKSYVNTVNTDLRGFSDNYSYSSRLSKRKVSTIDNLITKKLGDAGQGIGDVINSFVDLPGSNHEDDIDDLIPFLFYDVSSDDTIPFRATITQISDAITPTWNEYSYVGNPLTFWVYKGTTRQVSFSFKIYTVSADELLSNWTRCSRLVGLCYPKFNNEFRMIAPFIKLTIGDMYYRVPGKISSLTITIDDNTPWEINLFNDTTLAKLPHILDIAVTFDYFGDYLPQKRTPHFLQRNASGPDLL